MKAEGFPDDSIKTPVCQEGRMSRGPSLSGVVGLYVQPGTGRLCQAHRMVRKSVGPRQVNRDHLNDLPLSSAALTLSENTEQTLSLFECNVFSTRLHVLPQESPLPFIMPKG